MDKIVEGYTDDGKIMPARTSILEGKDLAEYWNPSQPRGSKTTYHKILPEEIKVWDNEAYDYGYYEGTSFNGDVESNSKGKYVIVWRKEEGTWKIYLDIWNRLEE